MTEVFLRRLTRWQADQQREAIADLNLAAYRSPAGRESQDRRNFVTRFATEMQHPGFDMLVAGETFLTGGIYGYPPPRDGGWWQDFRAAAPADIEELVAPGRAFVIAELMVLPSRRRQGIATRLQERLLARVSTQLLVTLIEPGNLAATAAYESWGWTRAGQVAGVGGLPPHDVWSRKPAR